MGGSTIFGVEQRKWGFYDFRVPKIVNGGGFFDLPAPKNENPLEGVLRRWGVLRCSRERRTPSIFDFGCRKNEKSTYFAPSRPEEWRTPPLSSSDPPSTKLHQVPPALLKFGSSARSSTLKSCPEIVISPLLCPALPHICILSVYFWVNFRLTQSYTKSEYLL